MHIVSTEIDIKLTLREAQSLCALMTIMTDRSRERGGMVNTRDLPTGCKMDFERMRGDLNRMLSDAPYEAASRER